MKTVKNLVLGRSQLMGFCCLVLSLFLVFSCTKEDNALTGLDNPESVALKNTFILDETLELSGATHFPSYALKEQVVVSPWELNMLLCNARLIPVEGESYLLETEESMPLPDGSAMLLRKVTFEVKITPSGNLKFTWPYEWQELNFLTGELEARSDMLGQFYVHTGCNPFGPGINRGTINYSGNYDGNNFYAVAQFMGIQEMPGVIPFYIKNPEDLTEIFEGPIKFEFSIELVIVE